MKFKPISISKYVDLYIKHNPSAHRHEVEKQLKRALKDYENGVKCSCGNDIWVIGSSVAGNRCFTCLTGESKPSGDFEIDSALDKTQRIKRQRHIDDIPPKEISGVYDDDGYEIPTHIDGKPTVCVVCGKDADPAQASICELTRHDQNGRDDFRCDAFEPI